MRTVGGAKGAVGGAKGAAWVGLGQEPGHQKYGDAKFLEIHQSEIKRFMTFVNLISCGLNFQSH